MVEDDFRHGTDYGNGEIMLALHHIAEFDLAGGAMPYRLDRVQPGSWVKT